MVLGKRSVHIPVSRELAPKARIVYAVLEGMVGFEGVVGEVGECGDGCLETMSLPEALYITDSG